MKRVIIALISLLLICTMCFGCGKKNNNAAATATAAATDSANIDADPTTAPEETPKTPLEKFMLHINELAFDTAALEENFKKVNFEKGVSAELIGYDAFDAKIAYDIVNKALSLIVTTGEEGTKTEALNLIYKDSVYVSSQGIWMKLSASEFMENFVNLPIELPENDETLSADVLSAIEALKEYKGDIVEDALNAAAEKMTWSEENNEIKCVITEESMAAAKDAVIAKIAENEGVKGKLTKENIEVLIEKIAGFSDNVTENKASGVITLSMVIENDKASALKLNYLTSESQADDVNLVDFSEVNIELKTSATGYTYTANVKSWTTDGTSAEPTVEEDKFEGKIDFTEKSIEGTVTNLSLNNTMTIKAELGDAGITLNLLIPKTEDTAAQNISLVISPLENEITIPENVISLYGH